MDKNIEIKIDDILKDELLDETDKFIGMPNTNYNRKQLEELSKNVVKGWREGLKE